MIKMFSYLLLVFIIIILISCTKDDNSNYNPIIYSDKTVTVRLTNTNWFTTISKNQWLWYGFIYLRIEGSTNADSIYILSQDGFQNLKLNNQKEFNWNDFLYIFFIDSSMIGKEFTESTILRTIKDLDTFNITLNSGKLKY